MLRRRILASAMASVMAIGSVAVVASADETAAAVKNVKTKADLEAYLKELESFRNNELNDYGSVSGQKMQEALDFADNVLADDDSTVDDYTAAYKMVEAVKSRLAIYSAEQLKTLVDSCKKIYESYNIYNEELGDLIYTADSYATFAAAYDEAESVLDSSDSRIITDAYETLEAAKKNLSALSTVTKSQFRTALKEYEAALGKEFAYDSWQRGTIDTGWAYWGYQGQTVAWGTLYEHCFSLNDDIKAGYAELDEIKALNKTSQTNLVDAYQACVAATKILNGFTAEETTRASKATVQKLIDQYHGQLVYDYARTSATELYQAVVDCVGASNLNVLQWNEGGYASEWTDKAVTSGNAFLVDDVTYTVNPNGGTFQFDVVKIIAAEISVKSTSTAYYIPLDDNGYWSGAAVTTSKPNTGKYKLISKGVSADLTKYINVTADMVDSDVSATDNHGRNDVCDGDYNVITDVVYDLDKMDDWYADAVEKNQEGDPDYVWATIPQYKTVSKAIGQWGAIGAGNCGLSSDATISASQELDGSYTPTTGKGGTVYTYADLAIAMELAETYIGGNKDAIAKSDIYAIDTTDSIKENSAKGSSTEWALVYKYLKYALSDKYDGAYGTHTKAEVIELIDKCYELAELTGDAALFTVNHNALVSVRQEAQDWVKAANKIKGYKDNVTSAEISGATLNGNLVSTVVYNKLEEAYNKLLKDYEAFKYSFGEIYDYIAEVSDMIDSGDLEATSALTTALDETAYRLSVVESIEVDAGGNDIILDNDAFTTDRVFQGFNRVYTLGDNEYDSIAVKSGSTVTSIKMPKSSANGASATHAALKDAYEALIAAVKEQTEVKYSTGDVNHDGKINIGDASLVLKSSFNVLPEDAEYDATIADFNADGKVDIADASAILKSAFGL